MLFTLLAISNFFDDFLKTLNGYNFIDKYIYSPDMDFSKLKPYVLNTLDTTQREKPWLGIIFTHGQKRQGDVYYRAFLVKGELETIDGVEKAPVYLCKNVSNDLSFNIVSNDIYTLQALENEIVYFYDGLKGYPCPLPKLPMFTGFFNNITIGEFTKYNSKTYGELCSLGLSGTLNYPILLKGLTFGIIKRINLIIGTKIDGLPTDNILYKNTIQE